MEENEDEIDVSEEIKDLIKNKIFKGKILTDVVNKLFKEIDLDGNKTIDKEEFGIFLTNLSETIEIDPPSTKEINKEFKKLDKNKDGVISKKEFTVFVKKLISMVVDNI